MSAKPVGNVVSIIDRYRAVIDLGEKDGVKVGQIFAVYELSDTVKDLDGNDLEPLELLKRNVEVIHVQNTISIVRSKDTTVVEGDTYASLLQSMQTSRTMTLPLDPSIPETRIGPVKVGDRVKRT